MIPPEFHKAEPAELATAMEKTISRIRQGRVFREGETVDVNGAKFTIRKIIKKGLVLHGLPSS